jgi:3-oxoacyl-[acyl-carrier protein] reductase
VLIAPRVIETDMSNFTKTESGRRLTLAMQALNRIGQRAGRLAFSANVAPIIVQAQIQHARYNHYYRNTWK